MVVLLPRISGLPAERLLDQFAVDGLRAWPGFDASNLPEAVRYAATGGARVTPSRLNALRASLVRVARDKGFEQPERKPAYATFDSTTAALLAEDDLLGSGEALRDDVWTFVGVVLAPDIVQWRFGSSRERYIGGVRNTFQRLWMRGKALDRGAGHERRWELLEELTEDALVQITERPSLGGDSGVATAIGEAWLRAARHHPRGAMESLMRRAILRVRIWNEVRSLADLPAEQLAAALDRAFDLPGSGRDAEADPIGNRSPRPDPISHQSKSRAEEGVAVADKEMPDAAARVLVEARRRGWTSLRAAAALTSLAQGKPDLADHERIALDFLLSRMRASSVLPSEVAQVRHAISSTAAVGHGSANDGPVSTPSSS